MSTRMALHRAPSRSAAARSPAARPEPVRGASRLLRGWAAALVATLLAAGSHTLANLVDPGASPSTHAHHDAGPAPILWILTLALAGPVCTALAGRRLSWWRLAAGVTASQLLFHWLYSATAGPAAAPALSGLDGRHGAHSGHPGSLVPGIGSSAATGSSAGTTLGEVPGAAGAVHADSPAMAAAHLLAAVMTVVVLRRGEVLAGRVADLAVGLLLRSPGARLARWIPAVPVRRVSAAQLRVAYRPEDVLLPSLRLRGPPEGPQLALAA
ncbi:hypothetical protein AB0K08_02665 [Citricoccus sp. NPDC055426]|uniref:hypothetical protein n=1 Tax=Citricoccus sp. NPDC055426 TaxID=3155536 RepID=UPI003419C659